MSDITQNSPPLSQVWRTLVINGRRTTVRLETGMWDALDEIAEREGWDIPNLCSLIDRQRVRAGLAPSIRVFIAAYYRRATNLNPQPLYREAAEDGPTQSLSPLIRHALSACGPDPTESQ